MSTWAWRASTSSEARPLAGRPYSPATTRSTNRVMTEQVRQPGEVAPSSATILVVDDDPLAAREIAQVLGDLGYAVRIANSWTDVIRKIQAHGDTAGLRVAS